MLKSIFKIAIRIVMFMVYVFLASPLFGWLIAEVLIPGFIWYWNVIIDYWSNFPGLPEKVSRKFESWRI